MAKKPRENKTGVYIFRLPTSRVAELDAQFKKQPIVGITSENLFARKIIIDYLLGRLVYLDPRSRGDNPLVTKMEPVESNR
jgi:hypothetical protein